ncbi:ATP-binding protein [Nonomuraea ceibae]|uniref:ATP-binding protein n=1 Tax=Nonomuraea ceibae TaxID=1935170 RepID=UPI001C5E04C5|nr:ATP-binding protein [Nonomuraea ceibae]
MPATTLPAISLRFDGKCLQRTRRLLLRAARERGLEGVRLDDFLLAADECVTNAVAHGRRTRSAPPVVCGRRPALRSNRPRARTPRTVPA